MALDIHPKDVASMGHGLVMAVGNLDPAGLTATAYLHLGFDYCRITDFIGNGNCTIDGFSNAAWRSGDSILGKELLALIFKKIHLFSP
jgi:hypothetical protein